MLRFVLAATLAVVACSLIWEMSLYRGGLFMAKGMWEFTKGGFDRAKAKFHDGEMSVSCQGRVFLVSGANSGIGRATAEELVRRGGTVHILCRDPDKCAATGKDLRALSSSAQVIEHVADVSVASSMEEFTERFNRLVGKLDVLVNNAGVLLNEAGQTLEGFDKSFATNVLGPYVLTMQLLPSLEKSDDARVITVSSGGMYNEKLDLKDVQSVQGKFDGSRAYSQQKRQQIIMMEQLAMKHPIILFLSMHPGWADTPGVLTSLPTFHSYMKSKLRSPAEGADTIIWLATIPKNHPKLKNGAFYLDRAEANKHLTLAWTHSAPEEDAQLMTVLSDYAMKALGNTGIIKAAVAADHPLERTASIH